MSDLNLNIEVTDSEIIKIEKVINVLNGKQGTYQPLESFKNEIQERFFNIGFMTDVLVYTTNEPGVYSFVININDRVDSEFDPDQMVYEATRDILGLGDGGVIRTGAYRSDKPFSEYGEDLDLSGAVILGEGDGGEGDGGEEE